jgi:mono/diheme cytochrome c family protein
MTCMIYSCQTSDELKQQVYYTNGRDLYIKHCQNCHGARGEGLGKLSPPLTDTTFLKTNKHQLACLIKHGSDTSIIVNKESYEGKMPDNSKLANIDIAQLIVYITNANGNKQGIYTQDEVGKDLRECR